MIEIQNTVKLGYNELDGTEKLCLSKPGFVINHESKTSSRVTKAIHSNKYVNCKREFVITKFVITEFRFWFQTFYLTKTDIL